MNESTLRKSLWFIGIFMFLAVVLHNVLIFGLRNYHSGGSFDVWNQVVDGKAEAEILISGSSLALVNLDCGAISAVTGKTCFNIGLDGSKINLDLGRFKTYLKHNPKPQLLIHIVGIGDLGYGGLLRLYQYVPYLNEDELYRTLVSELPEFRYYKYIPLYGFAVFNKELLGRSIKGLFNTQTPETLWPQRPRVNGSLPVDIKWNNEYEKFKQEFPHGVEFEISPRAIKGIEELINICQTNHTQVILVFPPAYYESVYGYTTNVNEIFQTYRDIARKYNIQFLDYSQIPLTHDQNYFYNSQHMNKEGAALFSRQLAHDIQAQ